MDRDALADGWVVWNEEREKVVLAYRPDVFEGDDLPAPCLPTIYVTRGRRSRRPGRQRSGTDWHVTLYLEPEVDHDAGRFDSREAALDGARELAATFARGEFDYRALYQVPRPDYFEQLERTTGRDGD